MLDGARGGQPAASGAPTRIIAIDTGITPVNATVGPGGRLRQRTGGQNDDREVSIDQQKCVVSTEYAGKSVLTFVEALGSASRPMTSSSASK